MSRVLEDAEIAKSHEPDAPTPLGEKELELVQRETDNGSSTTDDEKPTEEDFRTLFRVSGKIPWTTYTIAFVELCERFSYYGTTVVYVNYIQQPLPPGSNTGAGFDGQSGALNRGQQTSTGLTTFNSFWSYTCPLIGAYIADEYLGRFKTIQWSILISLIGHCFLIISALPPIITKPDTAIAIFAVGLVIMGCGTGGFKSNISPLIAEQLTDTKPKVIRDKKTGERVLSDPAITVARVFLYFYMMINIGSLVGQICMVFAEKYVGFWLSFTLPTIMFLFCPMVLFWCKSKYKLTPPNGSVMARAFKLVALGSKGRISINPFQTVRNFKNGNFWDDIKPSKLGPNKPAWMTFDDAWVDEVRRGFKACKVFTFYPLYWLAYNQMTNNLTSQAATMELHGAPNDVINNLNPLSLIIFIPIVDNFLYPGLRRIGFNFTPLKRIAFGFGLASLAMISAVVIQHYIYKLGECGNHMNSCEDAEGNPIVAPINVWVQTLPYFLVGFSEIFASITGLEYAFMKAPHNMRSLVTAVFLFQSAIGSALNQALVPLADDPLLVWNYAVSAIVAALGGVAFWITFHNLDKEEDRLNMLPDSAYGAEDRRHSIIEAEKGQKA
ncbi:Oligopeptide transporter [Macrophomina phaseolina MS6]|uniref:Oligopeptide transporter n=2 Tax=Macrophomina phaseolina TaxID=35725 RepID=K2QLR2_MACPH|nr:Oligopeptide transporter [Macrophomina phaseolina MS6]KAH7055496.1 MFS peptide transporter-like protein Ptr2 [Macrophomina phaseolina]